MKIKRYTQPTLPTSGGRTLYAGDGRVFESRSVMLTKQTWFSLAQLAVKSRSSVGDVIANLAAIAYAANSKA